MSNRSHAGLLRAVLIGMLAVLVALALAPASMATTDDSADSESGTPQSSPAQDTQSAQAADETTGSAGAAAKAAATRTPPWGANYPVRLDTTFSRPYFDKGGSNADFTLQNELERLIRGSYLKPGGKVKTGKQRRAAWVYASVSRMEDSKRVGRELVKAAKYGVNVRFIHGLATQSPASRSLQRQLNATKSGKFKICAKGKSLACLSNVNGAIMHSKIVMVSNTYTRNGSPAKGAIWTGSSNYGGRSAERTYNNGVTIYNDPKLWKEMSVLWRDMWNEQNVGNDYLRFAKAHSSRYALAGAASKGYTSDRNRNGMFYSNLANFTIYATPIRATPSNGRDPMLNALDRVIPDSQCRIRLQENRFKYRRISLAYKLAALNNGGCRVSIVSFKDDDRKNFLEHCRQLLRVCKPILDVLKTSRTEVDTAYAQPHDKTILIDAKLKPNPLNPEERTPQGRVWPKAGSRATLVLAGSAALTGSNLVASDEITTETTDPDVYDAYIEHWKAITTTKSYGIFKY